MDDASLRADEEEFHSAYRVFLDAVRMLASSVAEQCESMGDFKVAWELKDDVKGGRYLVGRGYLNAEQEAWLSALAGALDAVPAQVLPSRGGRELNMAAMSHPSWIPLRVIASHVLEALSPFTSENSKYLGL